MYVHTEIKQWHRPLMYLMEGGLQMSQPVWYFNIVTCLLYTYTTLNKPIQGQVMYKTAT